MENFKYGMSKWAPFKDRKVCERVRNIKKEDITKHPNPDFKIRVIKDDDFAFMRIWDIFSRSVTENADLNFLDTTYSSVLYY